MLDGDREEPLGVHLEVLAVDVLRGHADLAGAGHVLVDAGERQATLLRALRPLEGRDLRVDEDEGLVVLLGGSPPNVHEEEAQRLADLGRREPHPVLGDHRLPHVRDEHAERVVEGLHGFADPLQHGVRVPKDVQRGHLSWPS